ncbi:MAG TPA: hypothetical protein VK660_05540 [Xanthomonadaceae bacterium]|jgi:hypothetical protein|nr:hypothetical protein [Xanthomonadaceae bacterium]
MKCSINRVWVYVVSLLVAYPIAAIAQPVAAPVAAPAVSKPMTAAPVEARQFDFLIGQWQLDVHPKVSGLIAMIHGTPRLVGTWKAWRSSDGLGVDDELRVVDGSGNPISLGRTQRTWLKDQGHWKSSSVDLAHPGTPSEAIGVWHGGEMHLTGHHTDPDGTSTLVRTRYYNITANGFRMQQDRSTDNGQSWDEAAVIIDARRVAAVATH